VGNALRILFVIIAAGQYGSGAVPWSVTAEPPASNSDSVPTNIAQEMTVLGFSPG
jgi:hypothetical protein